MTTTIEALNLVTEHVRRHGLPDPNSVTVRQNLDGCAVEVQLPALDLPGIAAALLEWCRTLTSVGVELWRSQRGDSVHVDVVSILTGPTGGARVKVYGAAYGYDSSLFPDLVAGERGAATLGHLYGWVSGTAGGGVAA
jgi:hypothetical protein